MNTKKKLLYIAGLIAVCLIVTVVYKYVTDGAYRNQIPQYPNFATLSKPLQEQITEAGKRARRNPTANNLGNLGLVYYSCANYEKAAQCFTLATKKNNRKWKWYYYLGYLQIEQGNTEMAIANLRRVLELAPNNYLAMFYLGQAYQKKGSDGNAEKLFTEITKEGNVFPDEINPARQFFFPLKTHAEAQLARIYMNTKRVDKAEAMLKKIIAEQMAFRPAYRQLSNLYTTRGDSAQANKYAIRANDLEEFTLPPLDRLIDEITLISRSESYILKQIDNAGRTGNYLFSVKLCDQSMVYFPNNKHLISKFIFENLRLGNDKKVLNYLDKHFALYKDEPDELMDITDILYDLGHHTQAMKYFNQLIKIRTNDSGFALWLLDRGKKKEATLLLDEQLKRNPENEKILADVVRFLVATGHENLATNYLKDIKRISPTSVELLKLNGMMAENNGNVKDALNYYEQAFRTDPKNSIFAKDLASLYLREKMWAKAIDHYRAALVIFPNDPYFLEQFGKILIGCPDKQLRNIGEGIEYSERAFINFRTPFFNRLSVGKTIATAYISIGERDKATKFIDLTIKMAKTRNMSKDFEEYFKELLSRQNAN